jgi:hypothetical protein
MTERDGAVDDLKVLIAASTDGQAPPPQSVLTAIDLAGQSVCLQAPDSNLHARFTSTERLRRYE